MTIPSTTPRPRTLMKDVQDAVTEVVLLSTLPAITDHAASDPAFANRVTELRTRSTDLAYSLLTHPDAATFESNMPIGIVAAGMTIEPETFARKVRARRRMDALKKGARR